MRNRFMFALTAALLGVVAIGGMVLATDPSGVTGTPIAKGQFGEIDAKTLFEQLAGPNRHQGRIRSLRLGEQDRAGRDVRLALASWAEPRDHQERRPDPLPRR